MSENKDATESLGSSSDCDVCNGKGGRCDDESNDQWYWCDNCDAADKYYEQARANAASAKDLRANKLNRGRLETLERRHDHLFDRVEADPSLKFDAAECAALHWAIRVLRQVVR